MVVASWMLFRFSLFWLVAVFTCFSQDSSQTYEVYVSKNLIGTLVEAKIVTKDINFAKKVLYLAFKEIERIDSLLAWQIPTSEISKISSFAGKSPVKISFETYSILERSLNYSDRSNGIFDVTVGPLTQLWGFNGDEEPTTVPDKNAIDSCLKLVGYKDLILNKGDTTAFLRRAGMSIDLGGIGKGYAIDRASDILKKSGLTSFLFNAGGDVLVSGYKAVDQNWTVGIKDPRKEDKLLGSVELTNKSIATSGDYERFFEIDGRRYHHIIDPSTGFPASNSISVSIIAESAERADALATTVFITQGKSGWQGSNDEEFLIISNYLKKIFSPGFKKKYRFQSNK